jgi:hypothetical protein
MRTVCALKRCTDATTGELKEKARASSNTKRQGEFDVGGAFVSKSAKQ